MNSEAPRTANLLRIDSCVQNFFQKLEPREVSSVQRLLKFSQRYL